MTPTDTADLPRLGPLPPEPATIHDLRARRSRLVDLLAEEGFSAAVVTPGPAFRHLTGHAPGRSERLLALLVRGDGRVALIGARFEADGIPDLGPDVADRIRWEEEDDPFPQAAAYLGADTRPVALEPTTWSGVADRLADHLRVRPRSAEPLFTRLRAVKTPGELAALRAAAQRTAWVLGRVEREVEPGADESTIGARVRELYRDVGVDGGALVQVDETASHPHGAPVGRPVREGSVVLVDSGCSVHGYYSDMTRTFAVGGPPPEFAQVRDVVRAAQRAAIDAVRPGAPCQRIDDAARRVIDNAGHGRWFTHRVGHGIGLAGHEPPWLARGNTALLEPGMTVTIEPGIYLPGKFGVRWEDEVLVTPEGAVALLAEEKGA